ncbi:DUF2635 domain-containing protein [Endozoicomonas acroporae]|uniref:DUF2635 domain-containing protein n=1 Tax=Endozoicomonas acroporae TaxID=1701104 RepID=UPI0013D71E3E|nr:DUF2635 domain-containing protein [Endozoicomonas acroporae]
MKLNVKTHSGEVCRFPCGTVVTEQGAMVEKSPFLTRRLRDGSVIDVVEKSSSNQLSANKTKDAAK